MPPTPLQFQPISSQPAPAFWAAVNALKLDKLKLDDALQSLTAWLDEGRVVLDKEAAAGQEHVGVDGALTLSGEAFGEEERNTGIPVRGVFKNFNTIEEFKSTEKKKAVFDGVVRDILASFETSAPSLNPFLLVTFADLKKYVYHYWFAFPALVSKPAWEVDGAFEAADEEVAQEARRLGAELDHPANGFLLKGTAGQRAAAAITEASTFVDDNAYLVFYDPSSLPQNPGWPLRNILYYLARQHSIRSINVLCLRAAGSSRTGRITLPGPLEGEPTAVGWERNNAGKLASRVADLGPMMDPARLADQAVDLNLKLMRWRIMPELNLDKVAATRCLLLGAGTLGCYVSRALMGWGIRNITFVDPANVSFSNPVRQPLFDFEDCLDGGKPKAQCAADRLKRIFPGVNSQAHAFQIPMPGHPVSAANEAQTQRDVERLEELIRQNDVVFLLMDSRESRWLPTVIGASQGKIVINAALGFDGYLVMRHGAAPRGQEGRLGCYYCNDVVAPMDSLTDRTLDQMCTVTRPGVAPIASASAVELLVSLLQHPLGINAPSEGPNSVPTTSTSSSSSPGPAPASCLGIVPHQLRGALSSWKTLLVTGEAYPQCTACSRTVVQAYETEGWGMLRRVFNEGGYLEELTGLDALQRESEAAMAAMEGLGWGSESGTEDEEGDGDGDGDDF